MNVPMTAQNGITNPRRIIPRSMVAPMGAAGRKASVTLVRSTKGWGMRKTGFSKTSPVIAGTPTRIVPKATPRLAPSEKSRHFENCGSGGFPFSEGSASAGSSVDFPKRLRKDFFLGPAFSSAMAMAPCAWIGASGKGSFSISEISPGRRPA